MNYQEFLENKNKFVTSKGFDIPKEELSDKLFGWQKVCVSWALKKGKSALFEACGLGKTFQQLEWANQICKQTGGNVLIVAPLGVAHQTANEEAPKLNLKVNLIRTTEEIKSGINITNYEILDQIDTSKFIGVVLDESSILKNFTGKIRTKITNCFKNTPYKLCCTATPAPNDYMELLNHADFLGIMTTAQALSIYFINDMKTGTWRLKGHATDEFWKWVCNWALNIEKPSDIGFDNKGYDLPKLNEYEEIVDVDIINDDLTQGLFRDIQMSATSFYKEKKKTINSRAKRVKEIIDNNPDEQYLIWVDMNEEADKLKELIPSAVEVRGSDKISFKEEASNKFKTGEIKVLISKPKIFGYGMNFQNCHNVIFCGLTYSYENYYQALRRVYRFGQNSEVNSYIVLGVTEKSILENIRRKEEQQRRMKNSMSLSVKDLQQLEVNGHVKEKVHENETILLPKWI
ncbi:MAG TPA: helicase [Candidatus Coprosoma intestinipullorum]|uniref:Helicase n=1 Tax=Candidatus Coprosoma intestinipullorum TaxID=2840752 RepID=A0A9D0ZT45_9FIRM|nr:helicase [Candidatus Coprosoma intestinipullorum]